MTPYFKGLDERRTTDKIREAQPKVSNNCKTGLISYKYGYLIELLPPNVDIRVLTL